MNLKNVIDLEVYRLAKELGINHMDLTRDLLTEGLRKLSNPSFNFERSLIFQGSYHNGKK